jgi:hypothetical protein
MNDFQGKWVEGIGGESVEGREGIEARRRNYFQCRGSEPRYLISMRGIKHQLIFFGKHSISLK